MKDAIIYFLCIAVFGFVMMLIYRAYTNATTSISVNDMGAAICYMATSTDGVALSCIKKD